MAGVSEKTREVNDKKQDEATDKEVVEKAAQLSATRSCTKESRDGALMWMAHREGFLAGAEWERKRSRSSGSAKL